MDEQSTCISAADLRATKGPYINTREALNRISWRKIYDKVLGAGRAGIIHRFHLFR